MRGLTTFRQVQKLIRLAENQATIGDSPEATALLEVVTWARSSRAGSTTELDCTAWAHAREFGSQNGVDLTRRMLRDVATHEILQRPAAAASQISRFGLTRRDLDLALTHLADHPTVPAPADRALLRGRAAEADRGSVEREQPDVD